MKRVATIGILIIETLRSLFFAVTTAAEERPAKTILSPAQCVQVLKLDADTCVDVVARAWFIYMADAPLYSSRSGCRQNHQVCVVLQTHRVMIDERKGPFRPFAMFSAPLVGIRFRDDQLDADPEVLIDRGMEVLGPSWRTPILVAGHFMPSPSRVREIYRQGFRQPRDRAPPAPGGFAQPPGAGQALGPVSPSETYPVAPGRLRSIRRALQR